MAQSNLTGRQFGSLFIVARAPRDKQRQLRWWAECVCGEWLWTRGTTLICGRTKSCGCQKVLFMKHGQRRRISTTSTYRTWRCMLQRCRDPKHISYADYGGRGIKVCQRWLQFKNFLDDMGERPEGTTIDRKEVNGNYYKKNCRWATVEEQQRNKRSSIIRH